jgi:hypothetical protein
MSQRRLSIRISKALERRLALAAKTTGKSESEIVRAALETFCSGGSTPSAYDRFERAGLVGDATGLPPDLSTNPSYLDGFGRA